MTRLRALRFETWHHTPSPTHHCRALRERICHGPHPHCIVHYQTDQISPPLCPVHTRLAAHDLQYNNAVGTGPSSHSNESAPIEIDVGIDAGVDREQNVIGDGLFIEMRAECCLPYGGEERVRVRR